MAATVNNLPGLMNIGCGHVRQLAGAGAIMPLDDIVAGIKGSCKTDALDFANDAVACTSNDEAKASFQSGDAAMYRFAASFISEPYASEHADQFAFNFGSRFPDSIVDKTVGLRTCGWNVYADSCAEQDEARPAAAREWICFLTSGDGTAAPWEGGAIPSADLSYVQPETPDPSMTIATACIMTFLACRNDFAPAKIMLISPAMRMISIAAACFKGQFSTNNALMAAGRVILIAPQPLIFTEFQRFINKGEPAGAVKG